MLRLAWLLLLQHSIFCLLMSIPFLAWTPREVPELERCSSEHPEHLECSHSMCIVKSEEAILSTPGTPGKEGRALISVLGVSDGGLASLNVLHSWSSQEMRDIGGRAYSLLTASLCLAWRSILCIGTEASWRDLGGRQTWVPNLVQSSPEQVIKTPGGSVEGIGTQGCHQPESSGMNSAYSKCIS